jgi:hypothetical protein
MATDIIIDTNNVDSLATEAYRIAIENLAKNNDPSVFNNSEPAHAAIVLGNIFKNSNNSVKIFAKDFNGKVSDNDYYTTYLKSYLDKNKPITVVFEEVPKPTSKALALLQKYKCIKDSNISIKVLTENSPLKSSPNFTVGDNKMFRVETSKEDYTAVCSFNNIEFCSELESLYKKLEESSNEYLLN